MYRTGSRFGAAHLVDVLLGADTARIRELGHQQLSVYGIGTELDRGQWRSLFRQLISKGLLEQDPEARGGLRFGAENLVRPLLRGESLFALHLPPPRKERRSSIPGERDGGKPPGLEPGSEADETLLQALKEWRREQARRQGVPPYVVFHDRTLLELASRRPGNLTDLASIGGVGAAKLERYGEAVLAVLLTP